MIDHVSMQRRFELGDIAPKLDVVSRKPLRVSAQHAIAIGHTGCGKTFFTDHITRLPRYEGPQGKAPRIVLVYDPKGKITRSGYRRVRKLRDVVRLGSKGVERIIYAPTAQERADPITVNAAFKWVFERGMMTCVVEDAGALMDASSVPPMFYACMTEGRERGITMIVCVQRPKDLPRVAMTEATHFYAFHLVDFDDCKRLGHLMPIGDPRLVWARNLPQRKFYYWNMEQPLVQGPLWLTEKGSLR